VKSIVFLYVEVKFAVFWNWYEKKL